MTNYDYGLWINVIFSVALFGGFVFGFLRPKNRREWRILGVFVAFIVALFTEMYGFPLTIYILTSIVQVKLPVFDPFSHINGHLIGTLLGLPLWGKLVICQIGGLFMLFGLIILGMGWKQIHAGGGELVTTGIYGTVRHPQYLAMFIFSFGLLLQWTTLPGLLMFPILMYAYYRLALKEERTMAVQFGRVYYTYASRVPRFFPWMKSNTSGLENWKMYPILLEQHDERTFDPGKQGELQNINDYGE